MTTYKSTARSVSDLKAHLVLVTKYRLVCFPQPCLSVWVSWYSISAPSGAASVSSSMEKPTTYTCYSPTTHKCSCQSSSTASSPTPVRLSVRSSLGKSSACYWGKPVFWTSSYFIASCGGVTVEVLKRYVQEQGKPVESHRKLSGSGASSPVA